MRQQGHPQFGRKGTIPLSGYSSSDGRDGSSGGRDGSSGFSVNGI